MNTPDTSDFCPELQAFYDTYGATTIEHKIANLERELGELGGRSNMYATNLGKPVPDELRLAIYEQEWQISKGLIAPVYC